MRVGVEHPALGDLVQQPVQQRAGELCPVKTALIDQRSGRAQADAVQPAGYQHELRAERLVHGRNDHRYAARGGTLPVRPGGGEGGYVAGLDPEVEFLPQRVGKPAGEAQRAKGPCPASAVLEPGRHPQHNVQVPLNGRADIRALNFHGYLFAWPGPRPGAEPGLVDLADRRRRGRLRLQLREDLVRGPPERLGQHLFDLPPWHRLGLVLQPGQLRDELLRDQVAARGKELAQLDEGHAPLLEGLPHRPRQRSPPAGPGLPVGRGGAAPRPAQVRAQAMPHRDPADLRIPPRAGHRPARAADRLHEPGPGAARHQRFRHHDEDHRHDQRHAQRHGEERGGVPGPHVLQRPAQRLGDGKASKRRQQGPQPAHRQSEQPPRRPRQAGHQHNADRQHGQGLRDPANRRQTCGKHRVSGKHGGSGKHRVSTPRSTRWNSTRYTSVASVIGPAWAARWRRVSRSGSPDRRTSSGVIAANGIRSTESTSISAGPTQYRPPSLTCGRCQSRNDTVMSPAIT